MARLHESGSRFSHDGRTLFVTFSAPTDESCKDLALRAFSDLGSEGQGSEQLPDFTEELIHLTEEEYKEVYPVLKQNPEYIGKLSEVMEAQRAGGENSCLNAVKLPGHFLIVKGNQCSVIKRPSSAKELGSGGLKTVEKWSAVGWTEGALRRVKQAVGDFKVKTDEVRQRLMKVGPTVSKVTESCEGCVKTDVLFYKDDSGEISVSTLQDKLPDYKTLKDYLKERSLSDKEKIELICQLVDDCQQMWEQGLVHNDIKDENIIVVFENGKAKLKLTDFDLATTGQRVQGGTLTTMSPEVIEGKPPTSKSDLYSLAEVLNIMLFDKPSKGVKVGGLFQKYAEIRKDRERRKSDPEAYKQTMSILEASDRQEEFQRIMFQALDPNHETRLGPQEFSERLQDLIPRLEGWQVKVDPESALGKLAEKMEIPQERKERVLQQFFFIKDAGTVYEQQGSLRIPKYVSQLRLKDDLVDKVQEMLEGKLKQGSIPITSVELPDGDLLYVDGDKIRLLEKSRSEGILGRGGVKDVQIAFEEGGPASLGTWRGGVGPKEVKEISDLERSLSEVSKIEVVVPTRPLFYVDRNGEIQCQARQEFIGDYTDLKDLLAENEETEGRLLSVQKRAQMLSPLGEAVEKAHRMGVAFKDIKLDNIVLKGDRLFLTDYVDSMQIFDPVSKEARSRDRAMTPVYSPPEAFLREGKHPEKADVYSFAVTAYRTLLGKSPRFLEMERGEGEPLDEVFRKYAEKRRGEVGQTVDQLLLKEEACIEGASEAVNTQFYELMKRALDPNPLKRCEMKEFNEEWERLVECLPH